MVFFAALLDVICCVDPFLACSNYMLLSTYTPWFTFLIFYCLGQETWLMETLVLQVGMRRYSDCKVQMFPSK